MKLQVYDTQDYRFIDNPTINDMLDAIINLNGTTFSTFHIVHDEIWLYVESDGESHRARVSHHQPMEVVYLSDNNKLDSEMWLTLSNGENDEIPYNETISIEKAIDVCRYFMQNEGKLLDEFA